jgi:hypothetical protein
MAQPAVFVPKDAVRSERIWSALLTVEKRCERFVFLSRQIEEKRNVGKKIFHLPDVSWHRISHMAQPFVCC